MAGLLERLKKSAPDLDWAGLPAEAEARLARFAPVCPLYTQTLLKHPDWWIWLERPEILHGPLLFPVLLREWDAVLQAAGFPTRDSPRYLPLLRRFRRKICIRIAYRDLANIADVQETTRDLSLLAEFCVRECMFVATEHWASRFGHPWDERLDQPAQFCIIALGKLGGNELNFSSDIDLIYVFEGEGTTRRDDGKHGTDNREYFHRIGETITRDLNTRDDEGFLFRTDLRLRPGGGAAPLVPSVEAVENYYAAAGQTWERLAMLKARPIAGDFALGAELLDSLHSFRYPRHPPPSLLADVAAMKLRTEREVLGRGSLARDVKSGYGGIREIEFLVQSLQLLRGGRFPFLQTVSTTEALHQLARYEQIAAADAVFLERAYWFLREIEHRIQMAHEQRSHEVPEDPEARAIIATSLGFDSLETFDQRLEETRAEVRRHYAALFQDAAPAASEALSPWWAFFAHGSLTDSVQEKLRGWFGENDQAVRDLRMFVRGSENTVLMKDQVQRFIDLVPALDRVIPRLANPIQTLRRIEQFARRYGSRAEFFATCALNPVFLEVVALLFDRSVFIFDLLRQHPEIFDEVLRPEILRKRKDLNQRLAEIAGHPGKPERDFISWSWLYVRAEQVRAAIGHLLGFLDDAEVETELSDLAEAVLIGLMERIPDPDKPAIVALGKFGGRELSFGSDLDVLFVGDDARADENTRIVRTLTRWLSGGPARPPAFELDLRLRPHGDAGAYVPSLAGLRRYFAKSAQLWERQALTRTRMIRGSPEAFEAWTRFMDEIVFGSALSRAEATALWRMRLRVETERDRIKPAERAFKTGAGGLIDIEFALQILQLVHGHQHPEIRTPNTAEGWRRLTRAGLVAQEDVDKLLHSLNQLKRIEFHLRREKNRAVSVLPGDPEGQRALVCWMGGTEWADFWSQHCRCMHDTRRIIQRVLTGVVDSTALETHR